VDLCFTPSEAAEFLNQATDLDLSAEDVGALEARTEGWIAGLQLAALPMQRREDIAGSIGSFTGSHHFVLDYLVEEVLQQQPESVQVFLLQTSILDRLTGPLCDAVRFGGAKSPSSPQGDVPRFGMAETPGNSEGTAEDGRTMLEKLAHANMLTISLDGERRWCRYHQPSADLLRQRLRQNRPEQVPALHGWASAWYEQNGFPDEAI
jgi:LuxR family maltose regulon positive regulatory protein